MANETIESILTEDRVFAPQPEFSSKARIQSMADYQKLRESAETDYENFWA